MIKEKKLIAGVTKIAEIMVNDTETGEPVSVPLYYGNHVEINDRLGMVSKEQYYSLLDAFFDSEEGKEYIRPSEEQIEADIEKLHNKIKNKTPEIAEEDEELNHNSLNKIFQNFDEESAVDYISDISKENQEEININNTSNMVDLSDIVKNKPHEEIVTDKEPVTKKSEKKHKTDTRKLLFYKILSLMLLGICVILFLYNSENTDENKTYTVMTLAKDIEKGSKLTKEDFAETEIPISEYEKISSSTYIDADGKPKDDIVLLYSNINNIVGKYASTDLKGGDYMKQSSFTPLMSEVGQVVKLQLDDGTTVEIKATDISAGKSVLHMYAIISSSDSEGNVTNTAIDMGEVSFEGKALTDILNQNGVSLITEFSVRKPTPSGAE